MLLFLRSPLYPFSEKSVVSFVFSFSDSRSFPSSLVFLVNEGGGSETERSPTDADATTEKIGAYLVIREDQEEVDFEVPCSLIHVKDT